MDLSVNDDGPALGEPLLEDGAGDGTHGDEEASTATGAALGMIKCAIGAGTFALPYAFAEAGVALSVVSTFFLGALSVYTIVILERAERTIAERHGEWGLSYPAVARYAFPDATCCGVNVAEAGCLAGVIATCMGVTAAYIDFCAGVLPPLAEQWFGVDWSPTIFALILTPTVFLLALIESAKTLSFTSMLGNVAVAAGLIGVIAGGATKGETGAAKQFSPGGIPTFFGSVVFLFAIHIVVLPIAHGMRPKKAAGAAPDKAIGNAFAKAAVAAFAVIAIANAVFAGAAAQLFVKGFCHGENTNPPGEDGYRGACPNILSNFAPSSTALDAIILLFCVNIIFTTPLILLAPRAILEPGFRAWCVGRGLPERGAKVLFRAGMVGLVLAVALGVPNFSDMVDLVGCVCNSLMAFTIPPLIHLKVLPRDRRTPLTVLGHGAISAFGLAAMGYTGYTTIARIATA